MEVKSNFSYRKIMVANEHFLFEEKLVHIAKVKRTFQTNVG